MIKIVLKYYNRGSEAYAASDLLILRGKKMITINDKKKLMDIRMLAGACMGCDDCIEQCDFLMRHNMNLQGFAYSPEFADECLLCGKCYEVCPRGIDGCDIANMAMDAAE